MTIHVLVLDGPNLNLLGIREPTLYGHETLAQVHAKMRPVAQARGAKLRFLQSNHEGALIDAIHAARTRVHGLVINPGALTHYSYALRDAIAAVSLPAVEVHLSDIKKREPFRRHSVIKDVCVAQISGLGAASYTMGLSHLLDYVASHDVATSAPPTAHKPTPKRRAQEKR